MDRPIERVQKAYLELLKQPPERRVHYQPVLCLLRDEIAEQCKMPAQDIQDEFEYQAYCGAEIGDPMNTPEGGDGG